MDSFYQEREWINERKRARQSWKAILGEIIYFPLLVLGNLSLTRALTKDEAASISVTQQTIEIEPLAPAFEGLKVAFLTDFHSSALTAPGFFERVVRETNRLKPDVILLGGDYVTEEPVWLEGLLPALAQLHAPLGVYGVLGNHDYYFEPNAIRRALHQIGVVDITNAGRWLTRAGSRLRIAGVGDLWEDEQNLDAALDGAHQDEVAIVLSHNPDYAMEMNDPRVRLLLAGHTHGGQICLPRVGALITNSRYGKQLASGLVDFESFQLYVSRGLGTVVVPLRYQCPPEIVLLTLQRKT